MNAKHHLTELNSSITQFCRNPWSNSLTLLVIGIALALPLMLGVILNNLQQIARNWDIGNQMTIYLQATAATADTQALVTELQKHPAAARVEYLTREQTLQEFRQRSGFADALALLPANPLPAVIIVHPKVDRITHQEIARWAQQLQLLPIVDIVQLDQEWLQRLAGLIKIADRGIGLLGMLLIVAVALIIGNTIRLMIQNRQNEIELIDLMGASHAFIRRPFLYSGILFGLGGGALACLLVNMALLALQQPVVELASLYHSSFLLSSMQLKQVIFVLLFSGFAGWVSAYIVVTYYLFRQLPKII